MASSANDKSKSRPDVNRLEITRPDDFHVHFRDEALMRAVIPATARDFARALVMPNLVPPVVTTAQAIAYRDRILRAAAGSDFEPLMTLYLTDSSDPADVRHAIEQNVIQAVKLYPAGATTNSDSGVTAIKHVIPVLEVLAELDVPMCVHGEVTDADIDIFDREAVFIDRVLQPLRKELPELRIVMEHVTSKDGVQFVRGQETGVACTITPHHLMLNRNHLLAGGIRPHYYCLPIVKREEHRLALREAATSGDKRFFLGTDSAPHTRDTKENACGCAGVFNSINTIACLAQVFEEEGALENLQAFTSLHGAQFYKLPVNKSTVTLKRHDKPQVFDSELVVDGSASAESIVVFDPGQDVYWSVV